MDFLEFYAKKMGSTARAATKKLLANVFIIGTHLIRNCSVRMNFDNPVGDGLNEFMVVRSEKNAALESNQSLVDCRKKPLRKVSHSGCPLKFILTLLTVNMHDS